MMGTSSRGRWSKSGTEAQAWVQPTLQPAWRRGRTGIEKKALRFSR